MWLAFDSDRLCQARGNLTIDLDHKGTGSFVEQSRIRIRKQFEQHFQPMDHFFVNVREWLYRDTSGCHVFMVPLGPTSVLEG